MANNNKNKDLNPILEAKTIVEQLKDSSMTVLNKIMEDKLKEEIKNIIKESPDDDYEEEEDITTDITTNDEEEDPITGDDIDVETEDIDDEEIPVDDEEGEEEFEDDDVLDDYQVADGEYDLTDVDDIAKILQVIDNLEDDTEVIITKVGDTVDIEGDDENTEDDTVDDEMEFTGEMEEERKFEVNEDVLPFTTSYQKKPAMTTPSFNNPNKKGSFEVDKLPGNGNKKLGKIGNSKPFNESDETLVDDEEDVVTEDNVRTKRNARQAASVKPQQLVKQLAGVRVDKVRQGAKLVDESTDKIAQLQKELKKIKTDNVILTETVKQFRDTALSFYTTLRETALTNTKLGKIIKLFAENATTYDEKKAIIERFENGISEKEVTNLYETINKELKNKQPIVESMNKSLQNESVSKVVNTKQMYINEEVSSVLDMMRRVDSI
jgi:hypothetical protein